MPGAVCTNISISVCDVSLLAATEKSLQEYPHPHPQLELEPIMLIASPTTACYIQILSIVTMYTFLFTCSEAINQVSRNEHTASINSSPKACRQCTGNLLQGCCSYTDLITSC